tara:strand:- start:435 stop:1727 length:1293 start_codon:yes stop_codon:yes gene_type:complete
LNKLLIIPIIFVSFLKASVNYSKTELSIFALLNNNRYGDIKHHNNDILNSGILSDFKFKYGNFKIINQMFLSTDSNSTKKGGGKKIKGFFGYTNLGYLEFQTDIGLLKNQWVYGRYYLKNGFSKMGDLLVGKDSRPFDGFYWKINYKNIEGNFNAIQLEEINNYKRYLTVHSLKLKLGNRLTLLFSESSLYSTDKGGFNWQLLNPVIFWVPERENYPIIQANGLMYFGLNFILIPGFSLYSEFLIDDWQINKKSKGDLEPNEFGLIFGLDIKDWLFKDFNFWAEYTKITNRTYQSYYVEEVYTHRNFPIGHYLGNDFDLIQINISKKIVSGGIKPYLSIVFHRDGYNGMDTPFDEPWLADDVSLSEGFSEPFPTKPFVKKIESELAIDYNFKNGSMINLGLRHKNNKNNNKTILEIVTRIKFGIGTSIKY